MADTLPDPRAATDEAPDRALARTATGMPRLARPQSLNAMAEAAIRDAIIEGDFKFGDQLSELRLSQMLGISKTPVREALFRMRAEGLIESHPQRGTWVFKLQPEDIDALCEAREVIELAAARFGVERRQQAFARALALAVRPMQETVGRGDFRGYQRLDADFHRIIVESSGNPFLVEAYGRIAAKIATLRTRVHTMPEVMAASVKMHRRIAELVRKGDVDLLSETLSTHVRNTGRHARTWLQREAPAPAAAPPAAAATTPD
ncbi:MAG: GntR family transcriptional regulator [Lautropia sp.]